MFHHPAVFVVVAVVLALLGWLLWSAWHNRRADFIFRVPLGFEADGAHAAFFDRAIPVLVRDGFKTAASGGHTTVFERRFTLGWTVLAAIFLFPFGLVALLVRGRESVTVIATRDALEVQGYCAKPMADFIVALVRDAAPQASLWR